MKTLLIDNYDSFTYNLYHLFARVNGCAPDVIKNDACTWEDLPLEHYDNVVLSPGPGRPERERDFGLCRHVLAQADLPVLGICLGCQGLALTFGVRVVRAGTPMHGRLSVVCHDGSELFEGIPREFRVVRYHSLMVEDVLPSCLRRTAWTGDGIVMGLQHDTRPLYGVQFHPESISTEYGETLALNFSRLTRAWAERRRRHTAGTPVPSASPDRATEGRLPRYVSVHKVDEPSDPEAVFCALYASDKRAFWLDSSMMVEGLARFSFMGSADGLRVHRSGVGQAEAQDVTGEAGDLWEHVAREQAREVLGGDDLPFDFRGGYVGYLGYEMKADCGGGRRHASRWPDAAFLRVSRFLAFDHARRTLYLVAVHDRAADPAADAWIAETRERLRQTPLPDAVEVSRRDFGDMHWRCSRAREDYLDDVMACQRLIAEGESYEICLTTNHTCSSDVDALDFYRMARLLNPVPYGAFLRFDDVRIACCSPECFITVDRHGVVESKPIKGTSRRSRVRDEDLRLRDALHFSEKNRSENLMIVDLLRNDIGRVCEVGSVHVPSLMHIETYATVHQMVSTIRGKLRPDSSAVECVRAAFPPGSMTGAPKLRTMEIIDDLEHEARGIYSGCLGYFSYGGAADFSVVIRTAVIEPGRLTVGSGGAVVALSRADEEYEEMQLKADVVKRVMTHLARGATAGMAEDRE